MPFPEPLPMDRDLDEKWPIPMGGEEDEKDK